MNKTLSSLLLAASLALGTGALADSGDYNTGYVFDGSDGLPSANVPRFNAWHVKASVLDTSDNGDYFYYIFEAIITPNNSVTITNYEEWVKEGYPPFSSTTNSDGANLAFDFYYSGYGLYAYSDPENVYFESQDALDLANWVNGYLEGSLPPDSGVESVTEHHDGSSFSVSCDVTNVGVHDHYEVSASYDGAVLPTRNLNPGRDNDPCRTGCTNCAGYGMPVWSISQPYLNLWVHDTPVFYKTSLGQEVAFTINYKQRDTRPRNDGQYPTTGWNHNWYSYVHFDIPVEEVSVDPANTNTGIVRLSARGVNIQANWVLTNDYSQWEAILYAPDNSESYCSAGNAGDLPNQRTLAPMYDGSGGISGFRLVHGDGSQDIYTVAPGGGQSTYGIVERYGCVFDKGGVTNGMAGVWSLDIAGGGTPHQAWQDGDDAANYTSAANVSYMQQLDYSSSPVFATDDPALGGGSPPLVVEYVAYDALLTARVDPYGNAIMLGYDGTNRLSTITDYDQRTTQISYDTNGYLQSVAMPYGRTAHFVHDANGNLLSLTDAQGMTSSMTYVTADAGLNYRLGSLTTPYGTTQFSYQDDTPYIVVYRPSYYLYPSGLVQDPGTLPVYVGENSVNHAIMVTQPDLSQELYFYCGATNGSHVPASLPVSQAVVDAAWGLVDNGGAGGEASLLGRNCFHWGRGQTPQLSVPVRADMALTNLTAHDFLLGAWQHYPVEISTSANLDLCPVPTFIREGSPDGSTPGNITWFTYLLNQYGGNAWQMDGEPLNWNQITAAPDGTALVTSFSYDYSSGLLTSMSQPYSQPDGTVTTRNYNWQYTFIEVDEADGTWYVPVLTGIFTPFGSLDSSVGPGPGTATVNGYTVLSWPTIAVQDAAGNVTTNFYNARHQLSGVAYANGLNVANIYGADGFLQKSIALEAQATNAYVFQNGELASRTTPLGLTLSFTHDLLGRLTGVGFPDGTTLSNVFDKLDVVAAKDRLGHWSYATYDNLRELRTLTDRNGGTTTFSYCACGGLGTVTDPQTNTTTYLRDYLGRVTNIVSAAGSKVIERDALGRPFHETSTWGLDVWLGHNYQGLLTDVTNSAGAAWSAVFNAADLPEEVTDGAGVTITSYFDGLGRLMFRYNALGLVEQRYYSAQGLVQRLDALNNPTTYGYDPAGRMCAETNANQEVTQFSYDVPHRRVSLTDGRNHTNWWGFDTYGRQVAETNANGVLVRTNGYDANSRLIAQWTAAKGLTTFGYDNNGNVLSIQSPNATVNCIYDLLDRLLTMSDALGSHTFSYANFGAFDWALATEAGPLGTISHGYYGPNLASISIGSWVESITRDSALRPYVITSPAGTFTYGFNGAGRQLASLAMPGSTTTFDYDTVGEPTSIQVQAGSQTVDYHGYDYNLNGWITTAHRLGGVTANYTYDNIGQLLSAQARESDYTLRLNENLSYTYDASHNLATRTANTLSQSFSSDALNQLTSITRSGTLTVSGSITGAVQTLGVNGQPAQIYSDGTFATTAGLTLRDGNNMFVTAGSNAAGALVLSTITSNRLPVTVSFGYDLNGNMLSDGQRVFEYDDANQLSAVTVSNSFRLEFVPDGLGRRRIVREYVWSSGIGNWQLTNDTRYLCDGYLPMQERDANGNVLVTYTRGPDMSGTFGGAGGIGGLLARTDNNGSAFYHADLVGNITLLTDSSGSPVARYLNDPFGRPLAMSGPMGPVNRMRVSSMPTDPSGGVHFPFRDLDTLLQRFRTGDPIGELGGINLYGFAGNNPINEIDLFGLWSPGAHDALLQHALNGTVPQADIDALKASSRAFDKATQGAHDANKHSMCIKGQSPADAIKARDKFIRDTLAAASKANQDGNKPEALRLLGEALHPIMDASSPMHTDAQGNPKVWNPLWPFGHSPNDYIGNETTSDITPNIYKQQDKIISDTYNKVFGK